MTKKEFFKKYKNERDYEDINPINCKCIICDCDINISYGNGKGETGLTFIPIKPDTFYNKSNGVINLEHFTICEKCFVTPILCDECGKDISNDALLCADCNFDQKGGK